MLNQISGTGYYSGIRKWHVNKGPYAGTRKYVTS
jgi:hypothetical protein